jgi:hypothetical protein
MCVSRFLKSFEYKRRKTIARTVEQTSDTYLEDCGVAFVDDVRILNLQPNQIFVMDETGIWID